MPDTSANAMEVLAKMRGRTIRFKLGIDGWVTGGDEYQAEVVGNLRYVRPDKDDSGMHPTLCIIHSQYRSPSDPENEFGPKMDSMLECRVRPEDAAHVSLAPGFEKKKPKKN